MTEKLNFGLTADEEKLFEELKPFVAPGSTFMINKENTALLVAQLQTSVQLIKRLRGRFSEPRAVYPRQAEVITDGLSRMKVPGGWIVFAVAPTASTPKTDGLTGLFVSDPDGSWVLEPKK